MKNFVAVFGAVTMLAFPAVLVTAPASVSAEEALAEAGSEQDSGFSVLSRVSADRLSRQELHDTIGEGVFGLELTFWNGKASWNRGTENEEPGVFPEQCGLAGCFDTCRAGSGECESELEAGSPGGIGVGIESNHEDHFYDDGEPHEHGARTADFNSKALMAMCGSPDECLLFPHLHAPNWDGPFANGPTTVDFCEGIAGCGPFPGTGHGLQEVVELPPPIE